MHAVAGDGHFDLADPALGLVIKSLRLPLPRHCKLPETRPRFDMLTEGALINLRGVNRTPGDAGRWLARVDGIADRVIAQAQDYMLDAARQDMLLKTPSAFLVEDSWLRRTKSLPQRHRQLSSR
jgi:hypothetical protein